MANSVDMRLLVKHLVNGTLPESLCRICLQPLDGFCENIFTKICKEDKEYCIADILEKVCQVEFSPSDEHNVCSNCFISASAAYKFYVQMKQSNELLEFYVDVLARNITQIENSDVSESVCITLPLASPSTQHFDYALQGLTLDEHRYETDMSEDEDMSNFKLQYIKEEQDSMVSQYSDDDIVVVMEDDKLPLFYRVQEDGRLESLSECEKKKYSKDLKLAQPALKKEVKKRRKRNPMEFRKCSKCPIKYRFIGKLKEHMKTDHNIDLYVCPICKTCTEDEVSYREHVSTHSNTLTCAVCNAVFKRREALIAHIHKHEETDNISHMDGAHVCEVCGQVLPSEEHLKEHCDKKHDKKYTCYYCGRMYKGEISFEAHIQKHEMHTSMKGLNHVDKRLSQESEAAKRSRRLSLVCNTCGRDFVDERALMWHQRLHTNERPYSCDVCGRTFVSANRRNQHVVCAHTAPTRRCPLCPALFHMRSMVSTHIKKVHLKAHKRRNRTIKYQEVCWRTETVPIEELSVAIQNDILELQTRAAPDTATRRHPTV